MELIFRPRILKLISNSKKRNMITHDGRKRGLLMERKYVNAYSKKKLDEHLDTKFLDLSKEELYQRVMEDEDKINRLQQWIKVFRRQNLIKMIHEVNYEANERKFRQANRC